MRPAKPKPRRDAGRPRGETIEAVVLARTLEELAEHGIEGASVDRIARASEVNKTSVYRRFGTRAGLIAAALERVAADVGAKLTDHGSLRKDLTQIAEEVAALLGDPRGQGLARAALCEPAGNELAAVAARAMATPHAAASALVERAQQRGEWRIGVPPELVLGALVGALLHRVLLERAPLTPEYLEQLIELLAVGVAPRIPGFQCP